MYSFFRQVALHYLVYCTREWWEWYRGGQIGPEPQCHRYYWDLAYFYKFGLPKIPGLEELDIFRWWNRPQPDPPPFWYIGHELLPDILDTALGDPHPQPNIFRKIFGNTELRIDSIKRTIEHFDSAKVQLQAELERLEQLQ
jgi:hypothetical protein